LKDNILNHYKPLTHFQDLVYQLNLIVIELGPEELSKFDGIEEKNQHDAGRSMRRFGQTF
jgi:hypothetical protein